MTRVYRRRFLVRGYEIGATGYVHDHVFLNYVQQSAYQASDDAGYDTRRYDALGTVWVIRKQAIAYLAPLTYNEQVEVKTWVSDIRRVRSHREYELRRVSDQQAVALARADWVYIDAQTLFPRRIGPEMAARFEPNGVGALDAAPPLEPAQDIAGRTFVHHHRVQCYELDNLRHVNNTHYLAWLNQARLDALAEVGFEQNPEATTCQALGALPAPVRYEIEYFLPAVAGDRVTIHSRAVAAGRTELTWVHEIRRKEERLVEARATICLEKWEEGIVAPGERIVLPPALLDALSA